MLGLAVRDATMHGWRSQAAVVLLAGLVGACGGGDEASQGGGGPPQMPVRLAVATMDTVIDEIRATGQIEAVQAIELRPEVSGRLQQILVREGVEVQRGTGLFKVDDAELQAEVARLEAEMDLATQALDRTRELLARNASSEADLERAEATARSTRAQLELQQTRLRRTVVRAPFAGEVGERFVSLGDYLTPASPLTTLQTVDPQRARFDVPERYARVLAEGQSVTFSVAAIPGREFTGIVDFVDPRVRLPGRTIMVKARVANSDRSLKPGMFIEVRLATDVRAQAVVIPEEAVLPLRGSTFVWIATDENTASRVEVELGVRRPGAVEIVSGIEAGQRVVTEGQALLFPGAGLMVMGGEGQDGASSAE
ncbi:MAG: efflux RND transporter periplasmic adaptor subunit, partial [Gemmatimonadota bacterium]|nr:efflux RND transporter periplasmic adaptor subunit [Gemmatimonadota bacterium]